MAAPGVPVRIGFETRAERNEEMTDVERTNKKPVQDDDVELVREPAELAEEDLDDVAGGACGSGKGCCTGSDQLS